MCFILIAQIFLQLFFALNFICLYINTLKIFVKNICVFICAIRFVHYLYHIKQTKNQIYEAV